MKTAITDKTLSYFPYSRVRVTAEDLLAYAEAVFACGADYIEINRQTAEILSAEDLSEKYIFNAKNYSDLEYSIGKHFAYVVIPAELACDLDLIDPMQQIIVETYADEYSAQAVLMYINSFPFINRVSMIRLTGVYGDSDDSVGKLIKWYHKTYFVPIDVCPLNTMMTGVSDAIRAFASDADMVTLSFGRGYYYSALEQYLINVHIMKRTFMRGEVIKGICAASMIFTHIFNAIPTGLERILDTDNDITAAVHDIETGISFRPFMSAKKPIPPKHESVIEKKIKSIGLEREIEDAIIEMLKKVDFSFYKDITKRNPIE